MALNTSKCNLTPLRFKGLTLNRPSSVSIYAAPRKRCRNTTNASIFISMFGHNATRSTSYRWKRRLTLYHILYFWLHVAVFINGVNWYCTVECKRCTQQLRVIQQMEHVYSRLMSTPPQHHTPVCSLVRKIWTTVYKSRVLNWGEFFHGGNFGVSGEISFYPVFKQDFMTETGFFVLLSPETCWW